MTRHIPRHVSEDESDRRAIKDGWYAVARNGSLVSGPFPSRQDCAQEIRHPTRGPINLPSGGKAPRALRKVPNSWHAERPSVTPVATLTRAGPFWIVE